MSDAAPENVAGGAGGMPKTDVDFLIACLKNTTGGSVSVDTTKVAEALGYKNHRSVGNRIAALKKKYDIPFGSSAKGADGGTPPRKTSSVGTAANEPAVPSTPSKQRVTKTRTSSASSSTKKRGIAKVPKQKEAEVKGGDEDEGPEILSVQDPKRLTDAELLLGNKGQSSDEQDNQNEEDDVEEA